MPTEIGCPFGGLFDHFDLDDGRLGIMNGEAISACTSLRHRLQLLHAHVRMNNDNAAIVVDTELRHRIQGDTVVCPIGAGCNDDGATRSKPLLHEPMVSNRCSAGVL